MKHTKFSLAVLIFLFCSINIFSQDLYDIKSITTIELTFEDTNWNHILDQYYKNGNEERLLATVFINGEQFDSVGVRFKGKSSYFKNDKKKPLNIKLNYIINQNYHGFEKLKLSNGKHDPSFLREVLSYEIARKYMIAPLSNYAKVFINGSYYGLFSNSESINGDFGQRYLYAHGKNTRVKGNSEVKGPQGASSLEFYGQDSTKYYSHYELKSDYGWGDLIEMIDVLNNNTENIESVLDVDKALWMLAFNNVTVNLDSYSARRGNYYLLKDDNNIFNFILWDLNLGLGGFERIGGGPPGPGNLNELVNLDPFQEINNPKYPLIQKLFENSTYRKMYIAHCRTILKENFANGWYKTRGLELQEFISDAYQEDPGAFYSFDSFKKNLTSAVPPSGPPPGGAKSCFGIKEIFEPRINYLQNHVEYNHLVPVISNIVVNPDTVTEFSNFVITATVSDANNVVLAYRNGSDEEFIKLTMLDDGNSSDGSANDGIFGAELTSHITNIEYYIYAENIEAGVFEPRQASHKFYTIDVIGNVKDIVINEFLADNKSVKSDDNGEFDDWIELFNNTDENISLEGWHLTDNEEELTKWTFPNISIDAKSYLILWADKDAEQGELHTNFKLSKNGEAVVLSNQDGNIMDRIKYSNQKTDFSTGRYPNGIGDFTEMKPTFNAENDNSTGIYDKMNNDFKVKIYPNPTSDWLKIEFKTNKKVAVLILNTFGKSVWFGERNKTIVLDTSKWKQGIYFIIINNKAYRLVKVDL